MIVVFFNDEGAGSLELLFQTDIFCEIKLARPSAGKGKKLRHVSPTEMADSAFTAFLKACVDLYNANADGVAKWSARIEKPHNLSMDGFMKHAEKVVGLGEKPFGRMGPVGATHLKDHAEKFGRF